MTGTMHQGLGENLAFRINGIISYPKLTIHHIVKEFMRWEVKPFVSESETRDFIVEQFEATDSLLDKIKPDKKAYPDLITDVRENIKRFIK